MTDEQDNSQDSSQDSVSPGIAGQELPGRPESLEQLISNVTPEIHESLRTAIELGKWQDGSRLTAAQLEHCMEVIILYEARHFPEEERVGAPLKQQCESGASDSTQTLRFTDENQ